MPGCSCGASLLKEVQPVLCCTACPLLPAAEGLQYCSTPLLQHSTTPAGIGPLGLSAHSVQGRLSSSTDVLKPCQNHSGYICLHTRGQVDTSLPQETRKAVSFISTWVLFRSLLPKAQTTELDLISKLHNNGVVKEDA